jgi:hypothetical protein
MYICQRCKKVSSPGEKIHRVVLESRPKNYFEMTLSTDAEGNPIMTQGKLLGSGLEAVREVNLCKGCVLV